MNIIFNRNLCLILNIKLGLNLYLQLYINRSNYYFSLTIQYCSLNLISTSVLQYFSTDHTTRMIQTSSSSSYSVYSEIIPISVLFKVTYCSTLCSGVMTIFQQWISICFGIMLIFKCKKLEVYIIVDIENIIGK